MESFAFSQKASYNLYHIFIILIRYHSPSGLRPNISTCLKNVRNRFVYSLIHKYPLSVSKTIMSQKYFVLNLCCIFNYF